MSSVLCLNDSSNYAREWGFEKLVLTESRTGIRRMQIQAKNAYATGVQHNTEDKIRYYHYHNSFSVMGEPCREWLPLTAKHNVTWHHNLPYVYDDNMKKLPNTIKRFARHSIGTLLDPRFS